MKRLSRHWIPRAKKYNKLKDRSEERRRTWELIVYIDNNGHNRILRYTRTELYIEIWGLKRTRGKYSEFFAHFKTVSLNYLGVFSSVKPFFLQSSFI